MHSKKFLIAANAHVGRGGQGLNLAHMVEGLRGLFDLEVYSQTSLDQLASTAIAPSKLARFIGKTPVLRRARALQVLLNELAFDRSVNGMLAKANFFQGTTGQCLESLQTARRKGCTTVLDVITLHNNVYEGEMAAENRKFGLASIQHPLLSRRILAEYKHADRIRVMSQVARRTFLERGFREEQVFVAAPPIAATQYPQAEFRQNQFTISFVGLLEPAKGFHYAIEAFRLLNRPDSELLLWGNTGARPTAQYLREQMAVTPGIQLKPFSVSALGYDKVYGISSVLVHPSLADGFGYVVAEAMSCGIPVITTSATGASDWIEDGVNGYIVPPRDSKAIRDRLAHLMDHPALLRQMGAKARETMSQLNLERFRSSYENALGSRTQAMIV